MSDDRTERVSPTGTARPSATMTHDDTSLDLQQEFPADPSTLPAFRDWFARSVGGRFGSDRFDEVLLAVHEIASNAIAYGTGRSWMVDVRTRDHLLEVQITNDGWFDPPAWPATLPDPTSHGGRGLFLADELSDRLEHRSADGVVVVVVSFRVTDVGSSA